MADKNDNSCRGGMIHGVPYASILGNFSKETKIDAFLFNRMKNGDAITALTKSTEAETKLQSSIKSKEKQKYCKHEGCSVNGCNCNNNSAPGGKCRKQIRNDKECKVDGCEKRSYRGGGICWQHGGKDNAVNKIRQLFTTNVVLSSEERVNYIMEGMWSSSEQPNILGSDNNRGVSEEDGEREEEEDSCNQVEEGTSHTMNNQMLLPPAWIVELNEQEDQESRKRSSGKRSLGDGQLHQPWKSNDYSGGNNHQSTATSNTNTPLAYQQYTNKIQREYKLDDKDIEYLASKTITNEDIERASKRQRMSTDAGDGHPACEDKAAVAEEKKPKRKRSQAPSLDEKWMDKYNDLVEHYKLNGPNNPAPKDNRQLYSW